MSNSKACSEDGYTSSSRLNNGRKSGQSRAVREYLMLVINTMSIYVHCNPRNDSYPTI